MEENEQKGKKCCYCGNFEGYYTKGLRRYEKSKQGFCSEHHKIVENQDCCECWRTNSRRHRDSSSGGNPLPQYDTPSFCRDQLFHRCPVCVTLLCPALFHRFADTGRRCFYHRRRNRRHLDAGTPDRRALDLLDRRQLRVRLSLLPAWALSHNVSLYLLRHTGGSRIIHLEKERNKNK